jgi:putative membrane protein
MIRAKHQFNGEQRQRVNEAVTRAESQTAAEIVPVVAGASGRYDRAEDIFGLWLALLGVALVFVFVSVDHEPGSWAGRTAMEKLGVMLGVAVAAFVLGAVVAGRAWSIRRLFTPKKQMRDETAARARQVFYDASLSHTAGGTGVLIFVSLYERRAVILADRTILEKLGQPALDEACAALVKSLAAGDTTAALVAAIDALAPKLAAALPVQPGDANELPNQLVTID